MVQYCKSRFGGRGSARRTRVGDLPWSGNEPTSQPGITVKNEREVDSPRSTFGGENQAVQPREQHRPRAARSLFAVIFRLELPRNQSLKKRDLRVARAPGRAGE